MDESFSSSSNAARSESSSTSRARDSSSVDVARLSTTDDSSSSALKKNKSIVTSTATEGTLQNGTTASSSSRRDSSSSSVGVSGSRQRSDASSTNNNAPAAQQMTRDTLTTLERRDSKSPTASPLSRSRCSLNWGLYEQFLLVDLQPTEAALSALRLDSKLRRCLEPSAYEAFSSLAACTSPAAAAAAATAAASPVVAADEAFQRLQQKRALLLSEAQVSDPALALGNPAKWQPILDFFSSLFPLSVMFLCAADFAAADAVSSPPTPPSPLLLLPSDSKPHPTATCLPQGSSTTASPTHAKQQQQQQLTTSVASSSAAAASSAVADAAACMRRSAAIDWERLRKFYATLHAAARQAAANGYDALTAMTEKIQQLCDWLQGRIDCLLYPCQLRFILVLLECPFYEEEEKCSMALLEIVRTVSMLKDEARCALVGWYESVPTSSLRLHLENIQQMITLRVLAYADVNALRDGFSRPLRHALHALNILYVGNNRRRLRLEELSAIKRKRRRHHLHHDVPQTQAQISSSLSALSADLSAAPAAAAEGEQQAGERGEQQAGEGGEQQAGERGEQQRAAAVGKAEGEQQQQKATAAAVGEEHSAAEDVGEAEVSQKQQQQHETDERTAAAGSLAAAAAADSSSSSAAAAANEKKEESVRTADSDAAAAALDDVAAEAHTERESFYAEEEEEEAAAGAEEAPVAYEEFHNDAINSQQEVQRDDFSQWLEWRRSLLAHEETAATADLISTLRMRSSRFDSSRVDSSRVDSSRVDRSRVRGAAVAPGRAAAAAAHSGSNSDASSSSRGANSSSDSSSSSNVPAARSGSGSSSFFSASRDSSLSSSSSRSLRARLWGGDHSAETTAAAATPADAAAAAAATPEAHDRDTAAEAVAAAAAAGVDTAAAAEGTAVAEGTAAAGVDATAAAEGTAAARTERDAAAAGRGAREDEIMRDAVGEDSSSNQETEQQQGEEMQSSSNERDTTPRNCTSSSTRCTSSTGEQRTSSGSSSTTSTSSSSGSSSGSSRLDGRHLLQDVGGRWTEERSAGSETSKRGVSSPAAARSSSRGERSAETKKQQVYSHVNLPPRSSFEEETDFALLQHPFVLDAANKAAALKRQASLQQFTQARRVEMNAFFSLFLGDHATSIVDQSPYLDVTVRREHIVQDTLQHLDRRLHNANVLKKALRVHFAGEEGVDEGGVRKEFFQLLIQELFSSGYDMFLLYEESRLCWFNPVSTEDASSFRLIGIIFGLAIYNGILLDVRFPRVLFKKLLSWPSSSLEDLEEFQPTVARSLRELLRASAADLAAMELTFSMELDSYGERIDVPLSDKYQPHHPVTVDNCAEYVAAYADFILNKGVAKPYQHFHEGFHRCVDPYTISLFRPEELQQVILGSEEQLNFESLQSGTLYQDGFTAESETVKAFWEVAHALSSEQKKKLLMFVTGSDRVPIKGLASLRLIIGRNGADSDRLPTAHTCFNFLLLPDYKKKEKLDRLLKIAIENCKGFGLR